MLVIAGLPANPAAAETRVIEMQVLRVVDGDSVVATGPDGQPLTLRLRGIDAPERCQDGGEAARAALAQRVLGTSLQVRTTGLDKHGRTLATLHLHGQDLNAWMVAQGHAWSFGAGHSAGPYARQQQAAARAKLGVHADPRAIRPADFRRFHGPCERPRR